MTSKGQEEFFAALNGRFSGILRWPQFDGLWDALRDNPEGWHVYEPEKGAPPQEVMEAGAFLAFLDESEAYLRKLCTPECCGAVYADNPDQPSLVKIYNPRLMGGCGMGKAPWPQWLISRLTPAPLELQEEVDDSGKDKGLLQRMMQGPTR
jgi:hypothetical protein